MTEEQEKLWYEKVDEISHRINYVICKEDETTNKRYWYAGSSCRFEDLNYCTYYKSLNGALKGKASLLKKMPTEKVVVQKIDISIEEYKATPLCESICVGFARHKVNVLETLN